MGIEKLFLLKVEIFKLQILKIVVLILIQSRRMMKTLIINNLIMWTFRHRIIRYSKIFRTKLNNNSNKWTFNIIAVIKIIYQILERITTKSNRDNNSSYNKIVAKGFISFKIIQKKLTSNHKLLKKKLLKECSGTL